MLIGAAVFSRPLVPASLIAAFVGGLAPDLPMLGMVLWSTRITGVPEHEVFGKLYFSADWQAVFAVDHSLFLWSILLAAALWSGWYCILMSGNSFELRGMSPCWGAPQHGLPILVFHGVATQPWRRTNGQAEGYGA